MHRHNIISIREVIAAARAAAKSGNFDGCDLDDIEEVMLPVERELDAAHPNPHTVATYLNSLARSLRSQPEARAVVVRIDEVLRDAGLPTDWEH
ncbi:MAG TPA: hypothetical protein VGN07_04540 [Steroidobacteraceae bacterium]|jgi:hypothetical protein